MYFHCSCFQLNSKYYFFFFSIVQTLFGNNYGEDNEKPQFEDFEGDFFLLFFLKMFDAKNLNF